MVLFAYSRPEHTLRVINSLLGNSEAASTDLVVYLDGPQKESERAAGESIAEMVTNLSGFRSVKLIRAEKNKGLASSIIDGVTAQLLEHESVIVLEDDIEVAPTFLRYMNDGLKIYKGDAGVASIHAHTYPVSQNLPETFFVRGSDCWGWATWRRAWGIFEADGELLLQQLIETKELAEFDFGHTANFVEMLRNQIRGQNDSWAIRWHASTFVRNMVTLYPRDTQAINIGQDGSGVHGGLIRLDQRRLNDRMVDVVWQKPQPLLAAQSEFARYFLTQRPRFARSWMGSAVYLFARKVHFLLPKKLRDANRTFMQRSKRSGNKGTENEHLVALPPKNVTSM